MNTEKEIWKQVIMDNVEWNYEVSNTGKLRVKTTKLEKSLVERGGGYIGTVLSRDSKKKSVYMHCLVMDMFEPSVEKLTIVHINGDKTDNRLVNLRRSVEKKKKPPSTSKKAILRHDSNKNVVRYECVQDAVNEFGSHINDCLNGTSQSAYGYFWEYEIKPEKINVDVSLFKDIQGHPNYMISADGQVYNKKRQTLLKPRKTGASFCVLLNAKNYTINHLVSTHFSK
jgi:hypothetical protein